MRIPTVITNWISSPVNASRAQVALVAWIGSLFLASLLIENPLVTGAAWLLLLAFTFHYFVVYVPEVTGLIALNSFNGKLKAFGPGFHFKYPWDTIEEKNFFPLKLVTVRHTEDYAAEDGPKMDTIWSYQYIPDANNLQAFIETDHTTIDEGFTDIISGILSQVIGGKEAVKARKEIEAIQDDVLKGFKKRKAIGNGGEETEIGKKLEKLYGVNFKLFSLADIDYPEGFQDAVAGQARMKVIRETAADLATLEGIDGKDATNKVLVEQGKASLNITEVTDLASAVNALGRGLRGMGMEKKGGTTDGT